MNTFGHPLILKTKIENEIFRNHTCPLRIYAFSGQTIGSVGRKTVIQRVYEQVAGILTMHTWLRTMSVLKSQ